MNFLGRGKKVLEEHEEQEEVGGESLLLMTGHVSLKNGDSLGDLTSNLGSLLPVVDIFDLEEILVY